MLIHSGKLKNEADVYKAFPVIYFHHYHRIQNFLKMKNQINFKPKEIKVRVNTGDPGTGKSCGAYVSYFCFYE